MKNRFYGDNKDYIKYGLLNVLSSQYKSIGINWYLTDDRHGNQNHGNDIRYLQNENWKHYNPRIYPLLKERVENTQRYVKYCSMDRVVDIQNEVIDQLPDNVSRDDYEHMRHEWHITARNKLSGCDFIFFDPDIGVINTLPTSPIRASEYSAIAEIQDYVWCDWLVIQFLQPRRRFDQLRDNPITISADHLHKKVIAFISASIAFLYVTDRVNAELLQQVFETWDTKICTQILIA